MREPLSKKISHLRKIRGLTQEQLGEKLGISGQAVSKWENGESMPDIMLLPDLCDILGVSADALLEVPVSLKNKHIIRDFCQFAQDNGKNATLLDALSRIFNDAGNKVTSNWVDFGPNFLRVYDTSGMGFIIQDTEYFEKCFEEPTEDIAYLLRPLADEEVITIIRCISIDTATTREELAEAAKLDEAVIDRVLLGLMKRNFIEVNIDSHGKRGYLQSDAMAGVYMILAGCQVLGRAGALNCNVRFTRNNHE